MIDITFNLGPGRQPRAAHNSISRLVHSSKDFLQKDESDS